MKKLTQTNKHRSVSNDWQEAVAYYRANALDKAALACRRLLAKTPGHAPAWNLLGVLALGEKRHADALECFEKALALNQQDASYHNNAGIALRALGKADIAKSHYQRAIASNPDYAEAWFNFGNALRDLGDDAAAVEAFEKSTQLKPDHHGAWNNLGTTLRTLGHFDRAAEAYRTALNLRDDAQTRSNLAFALRDAGNKDAALDIQRKTVADQPENPALHFNLANALRDAKLLDEAITHYRHALALKPDYACAANNLGSIWLNKGEPLAALECYRRAVFYEPDNPDYLANTGNAERALQNYGRAADAIRTAIQRKPTFAPYYFNLANYLREWLQRDPAATINKTEIEAAYRKAIELKPDFAEAWNNLGGYFSDQGQDEEAIVAYQQAIGLDADNWQFHFNLAQRLHSSGDIEVSRQSFATGLAIKDHAGARIRYETMFPAIMESEAAVAETRQLLAESFKTIAERHLSINDPMNDIAVAPMFYLAYHGECNAGLMQGYTQLIRAACPTIEYRAPYLEEARRPGKIRIGFASKFLKAHTIGRFFRGILKHLNRQLFEIAVFMVPSSQDEVTRWIKEHVDHFEILPARLSDARERVSSYQLDILVYADIGMEPFTYYLAFSRLASVQCVLYGHPDTTGIPNIDYFLSGGACESPAADDHYTEKLIRLDPASTYTYYYRPVNRATQKQRADFRLPEQAHLYTCAQSMFKIHPEMDPVFDEILERDPQGRLLLFDDVSQRRIGLFKQRLQKRMRHYERVTFLPRHQLPDFLQILHLSDAVLDSFHFCGGNTSFDSFAAEAPVVTLPGEFMRGRQTLGLYQRMGFTDLVATNKADYVQKCLRLANEPDYRSAMRKELSTRVPVIYEDAGFVRALENFFLSKVEVNGDPPQP